MTENQNPEQKARDTIDALLRQAGWVVQHGLRRRCNREFSYVGSVLVGRA